MYYKFYVETSQWVDNNDGHTIAKKASDRTDAMMQILRDAIECDLDIDKIEFEGQYWEKPSCCNTTFRKSLGYAII